MSCRTGAYKLRYEGTMQRWAKVSETETDVIIYDKGYELCYSLYYDTHNSH